MFDLFFYVLCWLVMFILALPIMFAGLLSVALENDNAPVAANPLAELHKEVLAYKDNKEKLKECYTTFTDKFTKCAQNSPDYNLWLEIIYNFSLNPILMETDEVAKFRDMLEDENPSIAKQIQTKVGTALQHREKK
ncbi:hypothetical protein [uncultured Helicobacter sp.]|uniref:hypothetical protein n=1 Tax=uncultured Helicobacter sp. TaxID=175537 RepID=UPI001C39BC42|nr:hypothetical protein [Candidatus Helicobacter avicola]